MVCILITGPSCDTYNNNLLTVNVTSNLLKLDGKKCNFVSNIHLEFLLENYLSDLD